MGEDLSGEDLLSIRAANFANRPAPPPEFEVDLPVLPAPLPMSEQVVPGQYDTFPQLRDAVHAYQYAEMAERLRTNPKPTPLEVGGWAFAQEIEPQVREAVVGLWQRGYTTRGSGFTTNSEMQFIDGDFSGIDEGTVQHLAALGVSCDGRMIWFDAETPSFAAIKDKWDAVASLIPAAPEPSPVFVADEGAEGIPVNPARYMEDWLKYGIGVSTRPSLVEEIYRRNPSLV